MRLFRLLALAAAAAYVYRRFFANSNSNAEAGAAETAAAEPFSSEQLDDVAPPPAEPSEPDARRDTSERPTWLEPSDSE